MTDYISKSIDVNHVLQAIGQVKAEYSDQLMGELSLASCSRSTCLVDGKTAAFDEIMTKLHDKITKIIQA